MTKKHAIITATITIICALIIWLPGPTALKLVAAIIVAWIAPGGALLALLRLPGLDRLEQAVLAVGLSYGLSILTALLLTYTAGSLSPSLLTITLLALTLAIILMAVTTRRQHATAPLPPLWSLDFLYFAGPVAIAAFFSLVNLDYADYWGDEMNGLLRAIAIIQGRPDILFEHTKGPVEILIPSITGLLAGAFTPLTVRLPFALAHIVGIGGFYLLTRRMFSRHVGLLATLFLTLNGLYIAFGRMVQYQAIVFMTTTLSLLLAYHFYRHKTARSVIISMFLAAVGLLAHYDILLVLPALAYLLTLQLDWRPSTWQKYAPALIGAAGLFIVIVSLFYVPFLLHPHINQTSSYLNRIIGPAFWPSNSFDELYIFTIMYNSRYYGIFITIMGGGYILTQLVKQIRTGQKNRWIWIIIGTGIGISGLAMATGWSRGLPLILTFTLMALLLVDTRNSMLKTVFIWTGVAFVGYIFFVDHPRTHLQIIFPGWSILVALGTVGSLKFIQQQTHWLNQRAGTVIAISGLAVLLVIFGYYENLLFVDAEREYIFTYPVHKNSFYWEDPNFPFGSRRLYGAPHRLGWQMITQLFVDKTLQGDWYSNDDGSNLFWYTLGNDRNPCYPRYYFRTTFEQRRAEDLPSYLQDDPTQFGYVLRGEIWNHDRRQIDIFEFAPLDDDVTPPTVYLEPAHYHTQLLPDDFQARPYDVPHEPTPQFHLPPPSTFTPNPAALQQIADHYNDPRITEVQDQAILTGYDLDQTSAMPGGTLLVTLYWQAAEVINLPYKTFIHLENEAGQTIVQSDEIPVCGTYPTNQWLLGTTITDRHSLNLPDNLPPGQYNLRVGLYEKQSGSRMDLLDELGNPVNTYLELPPVTIMSEHTP